MPPTAPLAQVLVIRPVRSLCLMLFLAAAHLGAMGAVACTGLAPWIKALSIIALFGAGVVSVRRWRDGNVCDQGATYFLGSDGAWLRRGPAGANERLAVVPPVFVHPCLIVVRLRAESPPRRIRSLVLLPDSVDADTHRRLRVRLRFP